MRRSFIAGALSGFVEPICSVTALVVVGLFRFLLAEGAMLYVIFDEIMPESHSNGFEQVASAGFMTGFLLMTIINYF